MNRKAFTMELAVMALMSVLSCGLQAPVQDQSQPTSSREERNNETVFISTCPGYQTGNPSRRDLTGCETGTSLDPIDHMNSFGFSNGENPDWSSCGIPELPEAK